MQLLVMDFDGVISDSISECAIAGYNGYETYCGKDVMIKTPEEMASDQLNKFRAMRSYIRSGEDYIYLFQALNDGIIINSQKDFDKFQMTYFDRRVSYYQAFYSARQTLISSNYEDWIALNPLYSGMGDFLHSMHKKIQIVSTKASEYIIKILKSSGIEFNPKHIHEASGAGSSKTDIIIRLMRNHQLSTQKTIFIDDHLDTLHKVKSTGVRCLLAGWGYNTAQQRRQCRRFNLELVDIQQFFKEFKES